MLASRLARVRLSPAGRPSGWVRLGSSRVSSRSVCALPSKPPMSRAISVEGHLAVVPERRVAEVVGQAGRVDHVGVAAEGGPELPADLGHLEGVGEPVADEVVGVGLQHLGLGGEPSQRGRVDHAGPVAGEVGAVGPLERGVLAHPPLPVRVGIGAHNSALYAAPPTSRRAATGAARPVEVPRCHASYHRPHGQGRVRPALPGQAGAPCLRRTRGAPMTVVTPLVSVEELHELLAGPESGRPTLLDVRWALGSTSGRAEHEAAHLPGGGVRGPRRGAVGPGAAGRSRWSPPGAGRRLLRPGDARGRRTDGPPGGLLRRGQRLRRREPGLVDADLLRQARRAGPGRWPDRVGGGRPAHRVR